jgi:hypothetical protein
VADTDTDHPAPPGPKGTVHVPGMGQVKKKTALYGGLAAVALVLGYIWYKQRQGAAVTGTASGATVTDPDGNTCSALDPNSGYCPGTPSDQAYYADQSGVLAGGGASDVVGYDQNGLPIFASSGSGVTAVTGPGTFSNNAQWAQYCETGMGSTGNDAIAAALGKYITGGEVTADQVTTIDEAIAIGGYPPVQGPGGKPPSINQTGATTPTPSGGGTGGGTINPGGPIAGVGTVVIPKTFGERAETAISKIEAAGLKAKTNPARDPKHEYTSTGSSPEGGTKVAKGSMVVVNVKLIK